MSSNIGKVSSCTKNGGDGNNKFMQSVYTHDNINENFFQSQNIYEEKYNKNNNNIIDSNINYINKNEDNNIKHMNIIANNINNNNNNNNNNNIDNRICIQSTIADKKINQTCNIMHQQQVKIEEKVNKKNIQKVLGSNPNCPMSNKGRTYDFGRILGNGSFGVVCEARCLETGEQVAIKKVLQDSRYKNRELDIMRELHHPNVVELKDYFYTERIEDNENKEKNEIILNEKKKKQNNNNNNNNNVHNRDMNLGPCSSSSVCNNINRYLNVVMDHIPDTVYRVMKTFMKNNQPMPILLIKLYAYQMCRALAYLHSLGICHRDIKPQNLLVDSKTHILKLCDFGSAKKLISGEQSVAYICSRFYRAPELMLGCTEYTTAIDIWSIGCVLGEMLLGRPLFAGETSVDQLVKIIQVLGTPTQKQMFSMNPNYTEFRFPDVKSRDWKKLFGITSTDDEHELAVELLSQFLRYVPSERLRPLDALAHDFFDELRDPSTRLPGGGNLPELFLFDEEELINISPEAIGKVIPYYMR